MVLASPLRPAQCPQTVDNSVDQGGPEGREMQVSDQEQVWTAVAQQLRSQLTEAVWYSTFEGVVPLDANGGQLTISVPSNHVKDRILTRYLPLVSEALDEVVAPGCDLEIVVDERADEMVSDERVDDDGARPAFDGRGA